ncbi:MAG: SDR family oxidoreductase [Candidatus Omnitrophota bacterium]|jgi:dTDP-glucose 4,6-dehydratase|nr:MAG: SDR family oxidoreductase [Candidatus Omnitrophota bacterium]
MKKFLITGGAGFIGSHLCDALIAKGHKVICMDNFITGSKENIRHLFKEKNFSFIEHNVTKFINYSGKLDYVMHFASPASPEDYLKYPIQTLKVGSLGTHNALGLAKDKKAKFILASTSEVYGDPHVHPQPESYWGHVNPVGVRGCYDEAKRFGEAIAMAYRRVHRVDIKIVRIFNTYGPRMRMNDGRVVPNFIYQALNSKPITVYGTGNQTRSFCYVSDLVSGIIKLMFSKYNDPVNLGNPDEFTILELARKVIDFTGTKSKIIFKPLPQDDPRQRQPNISKAKKLLGWKPKIKLDEGLTETISWFRSNRAH